MFVCVSSGAALGFGLAAMYWHFVDVVCVSSGAMGVLLVGIRDRFAYCRLWTAAYSARNVGCGLSVSYGMMATFLSCSLVLRCYLPLGLVLVKHEFSQHTIQNWLRNSLKTGRRPYIL